MNTTPLAGAVYTCMASKAPEARAQIPSEAHRPEAGMTFVALDKFVLCLSLLLLSDL